MNANLPPPVGHRILRGRRGPVYPANGGGLQYKLIVAVTNTLVIFKHFQRNANAANYYNIRIIRVISVHSRY